MEKFLIDDITWNDLSMEKVYEKLNRAESSVGQEYLKKMLQNMLMDEEELQKRSARCDYFSSNPEVRKKCSKVYKDMGKTKKLSLYDYIFRFNEVEVKGNGLHYILILLLLAAIILIFVNPIVGILGLVLMFIINISTYFKYKSRIESYFMCFKYIIRMLKAADSLKKILTVPETQEFMKELGETSHELESLKHGSWLLTNSVSGSLIDVIMDYIRMLFHVDIIRFNSMCRMAADKSDAIDRLFSLLGEIEGDICISLYRDSLDGWCKPEIREGKKENLGIRAKAMYHPLTSEIVRNDLAADRSILLTGSNASGKSTFLKQLAINQLFAQTIFTCLAEEFRTCYSRVISSMALSDNILGNESYFIVEIKSIKRIFDAANESTVPVVCFIDEVLRGTNTKERIAASSQVLRKLSQSNALCFAATHDIELTELLAEYMDNYHFEEYVRGNDVEFDYKIKKGPAVSRNAIRLMQAVGFDRDIIDAANQIADGLKV